METVTGVRVKERRLINQAHSVFKSLPHGVKVIPVGVFRIFLFFQSLGIEGEMKCSCKTLAHTSAPSSNTPVSITVTYLSSIWTRSTALSMWDRVPGSLLQGTHRWITWPSMPSWGLQSFQLFLPALNRIPSSGHCSSFLFDKLIPSRIWLGSTIWTR